MSKIKFEDIKAQLPENWKLISEEYKNLNEIMTFQCENGHTIYSSWGKIRDKIQCPICKKTLGATPSQEVRDIPKPRGSRRVLALDQASHTTGYALYDDKKLIFCNKFVTNLSDEIERDIAIREWLISAIKTWRPDFIAIEGIQFQEASAGRQMGVTVFQTLARLQGIIMMTCAENGIHYEVCPTNTWRHFCGVKGKSRADRKRSMQLLVKEWYDMEVGDDESDAIGIGRYFTHKVEQNTTVENWEI